ncbi:MAG TPA: FecR family protein, partial [Chitinophagaceae bacterium]|nr:FecR family protein [Chitinophagaceae bacterium]
MDAPRYSSIEDFVFDASFRDWILRNDSNHKVFWEAWMAAHPQQLGVINHAKSIVYALSARHSLLSEHEIEEEIRSILQKAAAEDYPPGIDEKFLFNEPAVASRSFRKKSYLPLWGSIAAAALLVVALFYYNRTGTHNTIRETVQVQEGKTPFNASIEKTNRTDSVQIILLPDQSRVELAANSTLAYTAKDFTSKREVHLTGEAFFTVTKMPSSPFMVYTSNMVTKVLGTSFRVTAFPGDKKAFVLVKTGKVS